MNTLAVAGGILIAIIIIAAGLWYFFPIVEIPEESVKRCESDSDCIKVADGCCDCAHGGNSTAINEAYTLYWNRKTIKACRNIACTAHYKCINDEPRCVNNKCELVSLESS